MGDDSSLDTSQAHRQHSRFVFKPGFRFSSLGNRNLFFHLSLIAVWSPLTALMEMVEMTLAITFLYSSPDTSILILFKQPEAFLARVQISISDCFKSFFHGTCQVLVDGNLKGDFISPVSQFYGFFQLSHSHFAGVLISTV